MTLSHGKVAADTPGDVVFGLLLPRSTATATSNRIVRQSTEENVATAAIYSGDAKIRGPEPLTDPIIPAVRVLRSFLQLNGTLNQFVDRYIDVLVQLEQSEDPGPTLISRTAQLTRSIEFVERAAAQLVTVSERAQVAPEEPHRDSMIYSVDRLKRTRLGLDEAKDLPLLATFDNRRTAVRALRDWTEAAWLEAATIFQSASQLVTALLDQMPQRVAASAAVVDASRSESTRPETTRATVN